MLFTVEEMTQALKDKGIDSGVIENENLQQFLSKLVSKKTFKGFYIQSSFDKYSFVIRSFKDSHLSPDVMYAIAKIGDEHEDGAFLLITKVKKLEKFDHENNVPEVFGSHYSPYGSRNYYNWPNPRTRK